MGNLFTKLPTLADLGSNGFGDGVTALGPKLGSLRALSLYSSKVTAQGVKSLGPHPSKLSALTHLLLGGNRGSAALGPHLDNLTHLQRLLLYANRIGTESVTALGLHLVTLTSLKELDIRYSYTESRAADDRARLRKMFPRVENLEV